MARRRINPFTAEMELLDAASDGRAVARHDGRVIFVENGVPGDKALIHVYGKQKKQLLGRVEALLTPSPHRTEPRCQHFYDCGGCKWQMMAYEAQLQFKEDQVIQAFLRIAKANVAEARPILGCDSPYHYRNKVEFSFSPKAWFTEKDADKPTDQRVLGFHVPRIFDKILDIDTCHLALPVIDPIRNELRRFTREQGYAYYDEREHTGYLRNVVFRSSLATGELMLTLIVADDDPAKVAPILQHLEAAFPELTSINWIHNPKLNSSFSDLPYTVWKGPAYLTEQLGDFRFRISPTSFFQTNPSQAARLYEVVREFLAASLPEGQTQHGVVYDLYSGTGSIGIFVSKLARHLVGIEYVDSAVEDAWENVRLNGLEDQFSFYAGDMQALLTEELTEKEGAPDVIIVDPPRAGMAPKVVDRLLELAPSHILYVSCKPATQARDVEVLKAAYEVQCIQPVDMFPHTAHVENVAWLVRR